MKIELTKMLNDGSMATITVELDPKGNLTALVEGVAGPSCSEISQFLDIMGVVMLDDPTDDFYQEATITAYEGYNG